MRRKLSDRRAATVVVAAGAADAPQASYAFAVGDRRNPLAPDRITFIRRSGGAAFVNTGVHFLNGFDYLFDHDGGRVGFRWTGHVPEHLARVSVARDGAGPGLTQGQR